MRIPKYLSPSALSKWQESQEAYYKRYLADKRPPRDPQTQPMSVGSAFDAYVKSYFHENLFGKGSDPKFELITIFEDQVEEHNRDFALEAGRHCFECYKISGALSDLMIQLSESQSEPRFEFSIEEEFMKVPLLGKPDVYFIHKLGRPIILDFKVNGYCSNHPVSPKKGFIKIRDGWVGSPSRSANSMHKLCQPMREQGVLINIACFLEDVDDSWAKQLATYGWLCGAEIGTPFVTALDQLACDNTKEAKPKIRIAEHRCIISSEYQHKTMAAYSELWEIINSDHIFRDVSKEESQQRCNTLDQVYLAYEGEDEEMRDLLR